MPRQPKKSPGKRILTLTHNALPASVGLVKEVRAELIAKIDSTRFELRSEIHGVKSEVQGLKSEVQQVLVVVHRTQTLMEEQRSENRIVLDGLKNVMERQDRMESDLREVRDTVRTLTRVSH